MSNQAQAIEQMEVDCQPVRVYNSCFPHMFGKLKNSYVRVSDLAWSCDLISDGTKEAVQNKSRVFTSRERAGFLLEYVRQHMNKKTGDPKKIMKEFMEIVEETLGDNVYKYLDELDKNSSNPVTVLKKSQPILVDVLQYNLIQFAAKLRAKDIITDEQHGMISNPEANHKELNMTEILNEIGENIKSAKDPEDAEEVLKKFIEEVIDEMGTYAEDIGDELRKGITGVC